MEVNFKQLPPTLTLISGGLIVFGYIIDSWAWAMIGLLGFILFEEQKKEGKKLK